MTEDKPQDETDALRIPLAEETLEAYVTDRELGVVRFNKRVETHPMEARFKLRTDDMRVERIGRDEVVSETKDPWYDGDTLVIPLYEERLVTEKRLVLVEELRVTNKPTYEDIYLKHNVRKEVIDIETIPHASQDATDEH